VRAATVDRLTWVDAHAGRAPVALAPGGVVPLASARARSSTLHVAVDDDGGPAFVRRSAVGLIEGFAAGHMAVRDLEDRAGVVVPMLRRVAPGELWIDRLQWADPTIGPADRHVDEYVAAALDVALIDGIIVGTGEPHTLADGRIACEDVLVLGRLESDERAMLGAIVAGLVHDDAVGVADATAALCRARPPRLGSSAGRATLSLQAEWTAISFALSLHHVACAVADAGPRSEPLVLLADELLHRLDLAHHHRSTVDSLATRTRAATWLVALARTA
jgi:hypothetical protein